jgi:hypothetical protein
MIDDNYNYNSAGQGVDVYIIDTYTRLSAQASVVSYYTTTIPYHPTLFMYDVTGGF